LAPFLFLGVKTLSGGAEARGEIDARVWGCRHLLLPAGCGALR